MFGLAIDAGSKGQEQKLATALHKLAEEDPCFQVEHLPDTNETVISGLSDLHLRVNLDRLKERHGRSEEHTSELQSLMRNSYAVFCLKKKHTTKCRIKIM